MLFMFCSRLKERIVTGDLAERAPRSFAFGPFVLIPERQLLLKGEAPVLGTRALAPAHDHDRASRTPMARHRWRWVLFSRFRCR